MELSHLNEWVNLANRRISNIAAIHKGQISASESGEEVRYVFVHNMKRHRILIKRWVVCFHISYIVLRDTAEMGYVICCSFIWWWWCSIYTNKAVVILIQSIHPYLQNTRSIYSHSGNTVRCILWKLCYQEFSNVGYTHSYKVRPSFIKDRKWSTKLSMTVQRQDWKRWNNRN